MAKQTYTPLYEFTIPLMYTNVSHCVFEYSQMVKQNKTMNIKDILTSVFKFHFQIIRFL